MKDVLTNIAAILARRIKRAARREVGRALLVALALFFVGIAILAGIGAIGVLLAARWGVLLACLVITASSLLLAIGLVTVVSLQSKADSMRREAELVRWRQAVLAAQSMTPNARTGRALLIATALGLLVGLTGARKPTGRP